MKTNKILSKINKNKIWKINNSEDLVSDKELKKMIKEGKLKADDKISCNGLPNETKIMDTIYSIYLENK